MSFIHTMKSFFISDYELKKEISNIVAVAIFMDSIIRPSEVNTGYKILENLFDGEDYEFLKDEVDLKLDSFQEEIATYLKCKEDAIEFIKKSDKKEIKNLISIVRLIFDSDHDLHKKEEEMIELLEREKNKEEV